VNATTNKKFEITRQQQQHSIATPSTIMDSTAPRKAGQHLSDIDIAKILALDKVKTSQRKIASLVKCCKSAIQHTLATYRFENFQGRNPRREYHRNTTEHEDQYIERTLKQNYDLPLHDITNIISNNIGQSISQTTVRRRRSEAGLGSYIAAKKPGLRPENVEARLNWAIAHKDWTVDDWRRVIWSDESSIWVGVNPRRQWVIRLPGERLNRKYVKKTFKSAQVKVMVWACFTGERLGPLIVCEEGGIGASEYEDILYDGLFSLIDDLLQPPEDPETIQVADKNTFVFMHDNAPCHKATCIHEFLEENRVPVMEWPPQSPDLNPIENLWTEFKERFYKRFLELFNHSSKSLEARYRYGEVLQDVWYTQGMELVDALINSMPKRCQKVIEANGGWTKY
jgi:transposase